MGDPERGTAWEESILLAPRHVPLVCLSATVPNAAEIAEWMRDGARRPDVRLPRRARGAAGAPLLSWTSAACDWSSDAEGQRQRRSAAWAASWPRGVRWGGHRGAANRRREPRPARAPPLAGRALPGGRGSSRPLIYFLFSRRACEEAAVERAWRCDPVPARLASWSTRPGAPRAISRPEDRDLRQVALLLAGSAARRRRPPRRPPAAVKLLVEELFRRASCAPSSPPTPWRWASTCPPAPSSSAR